jgi:N-acetylglucosamine-6-phosphate deacetylase
MPTRLRAKHYQSAAAISLQFDGDQVTHLLDDQAEVPSSLICAPVFVDMQINGYQSVNFSDAEQLTDEAIHRVCQTLYSHGVAYYLPTLTTSSLENLAQCFKILASSRAHPDIARQLLGFHLEGPYIAPEDGPRGAHPREHCRIPSFEEFLRLQDAAQGMIKVVTLAPELPGAISFIEQLREHDVIPALGHTNARTEDIEAASLAGAVLSTHLGNAAHALIRRHPNYIWDQLANDNLWASLIVDGFHLPANVVKVMTRAKGTARTILVTDAVAVAGLAPGDYQLMGKAVELTAAGVVKLSGTDYLSGSAVKMPDAIFKAALFADLERDTAIDMASHHPHALLKRYAKISADVFSQQTFSLLRWGKASLEVIATVVEGKAVFTNFFDLPPGDQADER